MNAHLIERQFAKIGARALVRNDPRPGAETGVRIDIGHDVEGEFFDIAVARGATSGLAVIDTQPRLRQRLLTVGGSLPPPSTKTDLQTALVF